eukprot:147893_1
MVKSDRHSDNRCCECTNEEITCIHPTRRAIHVNSLSAPERREQEVGHRRQQRRDEHVQDLFVGGCGDGGAKNQKQQADRTKYGRDGDSKSVRSQYSNWRKKSCILTVLVPRQQFQQ